MATTQDHYKILGLRRSCTAEEINKAYGDLALALSDDPECTYSEKKKDSVSPSITHARLFELTQQIKLAHEILSDREKRRAYDVSTSKLRPNAPAFEPGSFQSLPQVGPRAFNPYGQLGGGYLPHFLQTAPRNNFTINGNGPHTYRPPPSFGYQVYQPGNNTQNGHF